MSGVWGAIKLLLVVPVLYLGSCVFNFAPADTTSVGGSGSEIVGVVKYDDDSSGVAKSRSIYRRSGIPFANGNVFIHPGSYLADTGATEDPVNTNTGADGSFRIKNVLPGKHLVYIKDSKGYGIAKVVTVPDDSSKIDLGELFAEKNASINVKYIGASSGRVLFYISLRGTGLTVGCTEGGVFAKLDDIPTGTDVEYMISIRMYYPFSRGIDIGRISLQPGEVKEFIFDELTK